MIRSVPYPSLLCWTRSPVTGTDYSSGPPKTRRIPTHSNESGIEVVLSSSLEEVSMKRPVKGVLRPIFSSRDLGGVRHPRITEV